MYNTLKGLIDQYIIENTSGEITGEILNNVLNQMVSVLGSGSKFKGSIQPDSEAPSGTEGENDYFYIATSVGTYTNFGNITVSAGELAFVKKEDSSWVKYSWDISSLLSGKQDTISDLATIRSGASAGATAYQKPQSGIPKTDLSSDVQASLNKADTAIQEHQDISGKADKSETYTKSEVDAKVVSVMRYKGSVNNYAALSAIQNPSVGDVYNVLDTGHNYAYDGTSWDVLSGIVSVDGKADKVSNATNGNFAGLDANGNLTDSGKKASDFATASQGLKSDNAILFVEQDKLTDQQRNTALANVSNQIANSITGKMGYKVLDGSKSFASQVTAENTIYEIRDVFDLGGTQETPVIVTIPIGSTLKFNGGVIKNCTLVNAYVDAGRVQIFDTSVKFTHLINGEIYPEWFGAFPDGTTDCSTVFNKICKFTNKCIHLNSGTYICGDTIDFTRNVTLVGTGVGSILQCDGVDLHENNIVENIGLTCYDTNTEYLISIKSGNIGYGDANIRINNVALIGVPSQSTSNVNGIYLCSDTTASHRGFYNVNISNIRVVQRFNTAFLFEVKGNLADYPWMTTINITNCWLQGINTCIDFVAPNDFNLTNNFMNITFDNVRVQYSNSYTDYFVKLGNCCFVTFKSCCLFDAPVGRFILAKNDKIEGIGVNNYESSSSLEAETSVEAGLSKQTIVSKIFTKGSNTSAYYQPDFLQTTNISKQQNFNSNSYTNGRITAVAIANTTSYDGFIGLSITNKSEFSVTRNMGLIGFSNDGRIVFAKPIQTGGTFNILPLYGRNVMPKSATFPSSNANYATGDIIFLTTIRTHIVYDGNDGRWYDEDGVRITANITKRFGSTTDRTSMTMYSYNAGYKFFDETLSKWVYWNGTSWVNLDGTPLS